MQLIESEEKHKLAHTGELSTLEHELESLHKKIEGIEGNIYTQEQRSSQHMGILINAKSN